MDELTFALKSLADETRLRIVKLLLKHDLCVGALAHHLGVSKAAVSQHLQILRKAGLVKGDKRGYFTHYEVQRPALQRIAGDLQRLSDEPPAAGEPCHMIFDIDDLRGKKVKKEGNVS
jgi:DNA-binding transcriptional ArsR family regulator